MYCPTSTYAMNVLSIMKMLSKASEGSSAAAAAVKDAKTFGFSVKDILDLPTHKSKAGNSNSSPLTNGTNGMTVLETNSENCLPTNPSGYHPSSAAALYYNSNICDNPYARCLPPYDMFTYSTQLRKFQLSYPYYH